MRLIWMRSLSKPLDRFSNLTTQEAFNNAFVGKNAGHGFLEFSFDSTEDYSLPNVFKRTPAGKDGWSVHRKSQACNGKVYSLSIKLLLGEYRFQLGPTDSRDHKYIHIQAPGWQHDKQGDKYKKLDPVKLGSSSGNHLGWRQKSCYWVYAKASSHCRTISKPQVMK